MRLKNVLITVKDMEKSKAFYKELFGLNVILDNDGNVILTEGLVLQDEETAIKGDMNLDGVVNSADLAYMLQYVNKRLSEDEVTKEQLQAGDVSRTDGQAIGTVNSSDLAKLLQFINHRIDSLD